MKKNEIYFVIHAGRYVSFVIRPAAGPLCPPLKRRAGCPEMASPSPNTLSNCIVPAARPWSGFCQGRCDCRRRFAARIVVKKPGSKAPTYWNPCIKSRPCWLSAKHDRSSHLQKFFLHRVLIPWANGIVEPRAAVASCP